MNFNKIRLHISSPRIDRFVIASASNKTKAQRLYKANIRVAQSFFPLLNVVEVVLRNGINTILTGYFTDPDWIMNQKKGFMSHVTLTYIDKRSGKKVVNDFLKKEVEKAEKRISRNGSVPTSGKVIAEQTFGFWTDLFEMHHYRILKGRPIQIFKHLPVGFGRKEVCDKLTDIRRFRNRMYHNEPICFVSGKIDFSKCESVYQDIIDILNWIDPEITKWIKDLNSVELKIKNAKKIK